MKLSLGADHRGASAMKLLAERLRAQGHDVQLLGATGAEPVDYPDAAYAVGTNVRAGACDRGILICGTGLGMCISANKLDGVRAVVVHDELTAQMSRGHNDANVLCLSADLLGQRLIEKIVDVWLATPFEGGRHERRVKKISLIERGEDPAKAT
jgi:ribose 5-phosphate isomerase B